MKKIQKLAKQKRCKWKLYRNRGIGKIPLFGFDATNTRKYVRISGHVWEDKPSDGKKTDYDNVYDKIVDQIKM